MDTFRATWENRKVHRNVEGKAKKRHGGSKMRGCWVIKFAGQIKSKAESEIDFGSQSVTLEETGDTEVMRKIQKNT